MPLIITYTYNNDEIAKKCKSIPLLFGFGRYPSPQNHKFSNTLVLKQARDIFLDIVIHFNVKNPLAV
jgi:hypothetical protein